MTSLNFSELLPGKPRRIEIDGTPVCVARVGDEVFAIADTCSHSDASLAEGEVNEYRIECWLHGAEFDLRTGAALTPPAVSPIQTFDVIRDGEVVTIQSKK